MIVEDCMGKSAANTIDYYHPSQSKKQTKKAMKQSRGSHLVKKRNPNEIGVYSNLGPRNLRSEKSDSRPVSASFTPKTQELAD